MRNKFMGTGESGFYPLRKARVCFSGFRYAVLYDFAVTYKLVVSIAVIATFGFLHHWLDIIVLILATTLWLVAEMMNTAIEAICNMVQPHKDPRIKAIKDIAAAAAGLCTVVWLFVFIVEIYLIIQSMK